ncbi:creatininase family protein, partial [Mycobacterium tuberculosis]|nr:creatininase family protein [Mycobacterium tuberculosis]
DAGPTRAREGEASLMLAIAGDMVKTERFSEAAEKHDGAISVPSGISRFYAFPERAPVTGTMGDPRSASAEKGERFLQIQADELVSLIRSEQLWSKPQAVWA